MRAALISDIHGNFVALEAVLADIEQARPDLIVCLGDVIESGPQPREVLARLQAIGAQTILGNTDERVLHPQPYDPPTERARRSAEIEAWNVALLTPADRAFLASFQATITLELAPGTHLLCFHGSPRSNTEVILATTPESELDLMLAGCDALVLAGGHTHTQLLRRYRQQVIVNPGSVGLPFELRPGGDFRPPWAEYALVEAAPGGLRIDLRRVRLDVAAVVQAAHTSGMPHAASWAEAWERHP
ncbi:MAG: metallophosphoesterase family protein [Roseiflexaceae bacterium]